jgi:hypothetical protein
MSRFSALTLAAVVALGALPAVAMDQADPERRALFVSLVEENGCRMGEELAANVMPENGFEKPEIELIVTELMLEGKAQVGGPELILTTAGCE